MPLGNHLVAGYWRYLLPKQVAELDFPAEGRSSCMSCPQIVMESYRPDYRCCTYFPRVPNFALGLALLHQPEAAITIRKLIREGFILPEGMVATPDNWAAYMTEVGEDRYGKSEKVLCPFLRTENGHCGIYAFRNSVCSTFFCLKDAGQAGERFWDELQTLGSQCELALGQWVMGQAGLCPDRYYERLNRMDPAEVVNPKDLSWKKTYLRKLWGRFYGKEEGFLIESATIILNNSDRLWDIANHVAIREAVVFDKKSLKRVPEKHREEARAELSDEDGETVPPWKIWNTVLSRYRTLWSVPGGLLKLSANIQFIKNSDEGVTSCHKKRAGFRVLRLKNGRSKGDGESEDLTEKEKEALDCFQEAINVDFELLLRLKNLLGADPLKFLSVWYHKKIITSHKALAPNRPEIS